jgi:ribonuclease HI
VFDTQYRIYCDGGCSQNGTREARAYASYSLESRAGQRQVVRLNDLPNVSTNNEAEYVAFISALVDLRGRIERAGKNPRSYSVTVCTDSQLLVGQLTQGWHVKAANPSTPLRTGLRSLVDEAKALVETFGRCDPSTSLRAGVTKVARDEIVRVLGH